MRRGWRHLYNYLLYSTLGVIEPCRLLAFLAQRTIIIETDVVNGTSFRTVSIGTSDARKGARSLF
jgi:hypothetical protein